MVAPLIAGAVRVTRAKKAISKGGKVGAKSAVAHQRKQLLQTKRGTPVKSPRHRGREDNVRSARITQPYRHALRTAEESTGTTKIKKIKTFRSALMALGSVALPMMMQSFFGILTLTSLFVEETWWGWVLPGITIASIFWIVTIMFGVYTMFITAFLMGNALKDWKVVLAFIFCFCGNWAPGIQIVPWVGVWIFFIIYNNR